jgi:hypothetical protein
MDVKNNSTVKQGTETGKEPCHIIRTAFCRHFYPLQYNANRKEIQAQKQKRKIFFATRRGVKKNEKKSLETLAFLNKLIYIIIKITTR